MQGKIKHQKNDNIIFGEISGTLGHKDTLTNCCQILEMLEYLDLSDGLTLDAQFGLYLTLENVIAALNAVKKEMPSS